MCNSLVGDYKSASLYTITCPNPVKLYVPFLQQNDTDQVPAGPSFDVVVAIDFGTTSSGYAYAFTKEPECIHTMRWASTAIQTFTDEKFEGSMDVHQHNGI